MTVDWLQSSLLHSRPKSTVGTPAYIAPEVLSRREYDGKVNLLIFLIRRLVSPFASPNVYSWLKPRNDVQKCVHGLAN